MSGVTPRREGRDVWVRYPPGHGANLRRTRYAGWAAAVVVAVVWRATEASVLLDGVAALGPRRDVVDVALLGRDLAAFGMRAVSITHFDGASECAGEEAASASDV